MQTYYSQLSTQLPHINWQQNVLLAPFTAVKLGGPAQVFAQIENDDDFAAAVSFCQLHHIPLTVIGWGANTLIADRGISGVVLKNACRTITVLPDDTRTRSTLPATTEDAPTPRFTQLATDTNTFASLEYDESDAPQVRVQLSAGTPLAFAIAHLLTQNITGLQWFARIPATLGGAVFNNIHGGSHFLSELVESVSVISATGEQIVLSNSACEFGYDYSVFHTVPHIITSVTLNLYRGDATRAQDVVQRWSVQKRSQPQRSLGCTFQNISESDQIRLHLPTPSAGYLIDQVLHLKGYSDAGVTISPAHAAFLESSPEATSAAYLRVIKHVIKTAQQQCQLSLKPEIFFKGFTPDELAGIIELAKESV